MIKYFFKFLIIICCSVSFCALADEASQSLPPRLSVQTIEKMKEVDHVFFLMQKRLAMMHEVAQWKWNTKTQIEDLPREQQILKQIGNLATAYGLNKDWALTYFQAQMDAAKMIQHHDFKLWIEQEIKEFESFVDLNTEIRPYLDRLTKELIQALVDIQPYLQDGSILQLIPQHPLSSRAYDTINEDVWLKAVEPLYSLIP